MCIRKKLPIALIRRVLTFRRFITVYVERFALTPSGGSCGGLIIFLNLVGVSRVPIRITSGWDQVRVEQGSGQKLLRTPT